MTRNTVHECAGVTGWQMQTAQMEVTVDYQCMECGSVWSSLAAADGCATIDAAADRAARQQRGARVDNGIVKSPEHGNPTRNS